MDVVFYIASAVAIIAALNVVFQRTPAYSALSMLVVLTSLAVLYLLLGAEFIAVIQVIVYAGAIMVLFVLVIMLLNAQRETPSFGSRLAQWAWQPLLVIFIFEIVFALWRHYSPLAAPLAAVPGSPHAIGELLFHTYVLPFEVTSVLIIVAILGAVVLAKKDF
jgi:NADH-quinone oxidoreductase subunit J